MFKELKELLEEKEFRLTLEKFGKEGRDDNLTNEVYFDKLLDHKSKDIYDYGDYDKEENPYEKNPILAYENEYYDKMDSGLMTDVELEEHARIAKDFGVDVSEEVANSKKIREERIKNEEKK